MSNDDNYINYERNRALTVFGFDVYNKLNQEGITTDEFMAWIVKRRKMIAELLDRLKHG